jgi:hypothetical protein
MYSPRIALAWIAALAISYAGCASDGKVIATPEAKAIAQNQVPPTYSCVTTEEFAATRGVSVPVEKDRLDDHFAFACSPRLDGAKNSSTIGVRGQSLLIYVHKTNRSTLAPHEF